MKNRFLINLFLILFSPLGVSAQEVNVDSLKILLQTEKHDTTRANVLLLIAESSGEDGNWMDYNSQALVLSEKNIPTAKGNSLKAFLRVKAGAYNNIGYDQTTKGNLASALNYYTKSLQIVQEIKSDSDIAFI